ncbi:MAG: hypothetical protein AB7G17_01390 [Phycisphaerales bacterium]
MPVQHDDDQYAAYFAELLKKDLSGRSPSIPPKSWEWTCVLLWMAEEARALVDHLTLSPGTRRQVLDLAEQAREEVRKTRRACPELVPVGV